MRVMSHLLKPLWSLHLAVLLGACAIAPRSAEPSSSVTERPAECQMEQTDAAWLAAAIANWRVVAREKLLISPDPLPMMIMTDAGCQYASRNLTGGRIRWLGKRHNGSISLPDGSSVPLGVTAFAKPLDEREDGFFVMALPSVWRSAGVESGIGLERLMDGVLLHELMHAYQFYYANPRLAELTRRYGLPDTIGDDSLQETFESDSAYVSVYEAERNLLFEAAGAPDHNQACELASRALNKMHERRSRWFTGESAWADLDEVFLLMEGVGQWAMYAWYVDPRGGALDRQTAIHELRRGGKYWTQDAGLALFLVIDRLLPGWQRLAFARPPVTGAALLAQAVDKCPAGQLSEEPP